MIGRLGFLLLNVFGAAALIGLVRGVAIGRSLLDPNMLANLAIALILGGVSVYFVRSRRAETKFIAWLTANADAIRGGEASYRGIGITPTTELRVYEATVSLVVVSMKLPSRHFVAGRESSWLAALACTLTSLTVGWWGVPWGPLWTIQTIARNVIGGRRRIVADLLPARSESNAADTPEPDEPLRASPPLAPAVRFDRDLGPRRASRLRGWVEVGGGFVAIVVGVLVTLFTYNSVKTGGGKYLIAYGPVLAGFTMMIRGIVRLLALEGGFTAATTSPSERDDVGLAIGFKSFIAYRYLMARHHRISRPVIVAFLLFSFLGVTSLIVEHTLLTHSNPLGLQPDLQELVAKVVTGIKIGGFVLLFFTVIIGALRYVFSFFTTVPLVGVWIGTGALVCVLSVMSGFESDLREKILGSNAHIQVTREDGEFTEWHQVKARLDAIPGVVASTPYAVSEVVIAANNNGMPVIIKGIDPATVGKVTELVHDLEDRDAMKRLLPLVDDLHDLRVPQHSPPAGGLDPAPSDLPTGGDPIDFSQPSAAGSGSDEIDDESGSAGSGDGIPAPPQVPVPVPVIDPPPADLIGTDEPPIDYSDPGSGYVDPSIHVIDLPVDQPSLSRRTQSLPGILVGRELVKQTHLYTGQEVRVVSPLSDPSNPDATGTPIPFNRDYRVAGIFFTGMYEYDLKYVYVTLDSLDDFLDRGDAVDGIEIRVDNPDNADKYVEQISKLLGAKYRVQDWNTLNRSLFSALELEKIAMFLVLGIVILVASFSIVGNLIMVVVEKAREIALLKTLGASSFGVMQVFAIQGLLIGFIGTVLGVTTGLAACWAGKTFGIPLNPDVYYIDRMPVHVELGSVLVTAAAGVVISILATLYPALLAARVRPAAGMRH